MFRSSGTWVVTDESTNITCIVVKLAASFVIPYSTPLGVCSIDCKLSTGPGYIMYLYFF